MQDPKCKICRRAGEKLFLKGERCYSPKCSIIRRPYPPGPKGKRRKGRPSEYSRQLAEKQKLKKWYGLREAQFSKYAKKAMAELGKVEDTSALLVQMLEMRLDNVVYRMGFTLSREKARQMVSHGYFLINGRPSNIPSRRLHVEDEIALKSNKKNKEIVKEINRILEKTDAPSWLEVDKKELKGKVVGVPTKEEASLPVQISSIFEFYSR